MKYEKQLEKSKIEKLEQYKEFQKKNISDLSKLIIPKNFTIKIIEPESVSHLNYDRGFFVTAHIFYKDEIVGLVDPRFSQSLSDIKIVSLYLQVYGIFNSFLESFNYINEIHDIDRLSRGEDLNTLQETLDFLEELRITMDKKINKFLN